jgi:hypothetical protein
MLWLQSLWSPPKQPMDGDGSVSLWGKLFIVAYIIGWLALGIALYAHWSEWSAPLKYSLALVEVLLAPDLAGIKGVFSKANA